MTTRAGLDDPEKYWPTPMDVCRAAAAIEMVERMMAAARVARAAKGPKGGAKKARRRREDVANLSRPSG